jgi:acetolactate synthase I/II/III large subunit
VDAAARILGSGQPTVLLLGDVSLRADGLAFAGRIAAKSGAQLLAQTFNARVERGASPTPVERVPYFVDLALAVFKEVRHVILVGACAPVAFFGYPGKPSALTPPGCDIQTLAAPHEDLTGALGALAEAIGAPSATMRPTDRPPPVSHRTAQPCFQKSLFSIIGQSALTVARNFAMKFSSTDRVNSISVLYAQ